MKEMFSHDSEFITRDSRKKRWAVPYHHEALNCRVENLISRNVEYIKGKRILDLACHFGTFSYAAIMEGASFVHGVDSEAGLIEQADELFRMHSVDTDLYSFSQGDVEAFFKNQADDSFDTVFCFGLLYYLPDPVHLLREMKRVAKDALILDTFTAYYAPCISKDGAVISEKMNYDAYELPLMIYPTTKSVKGDYTLAEGFMNDDNSCLISIMSLPSVSALENFFMQLGLAFEKIDWSDYSVNNFQWHDFIRNETKYNSHWADIYLCNIRVSYILKP